MVVPHAALGRGPGAGDGAEQGGLARPARPDDTHEAPLGHREADIVEQDLALGRTDDESLGDQGDVAGVGEFLEFVADNAKGRVPDSDDVVYIQHRGSDAPAVDERAVVATEIDDLVLSVARLAEFRVVPGHDQIGHDNVVVGGAADPQPSGPHLDGRDRLAVDAGPADHRRRHRAGQLGPVLGAAQPELDLAVDARPPNAAGAHKRAVHAADVLEGPAVLVGAQHAVPPGHPVVIHGDVSRRITPDLVRPAGPKRPDRPLGPYDECRRGH